MKYGHVSLWEKQCKEPAEIKFKGIYDRCPRCTYSVFLLPLRCYLVMQTPALRLCFPDPYRISSTSEWPGSSPNLQLQFRHCLWMHFVQLYRYWHGSQVQ